MVRVRIIPANLSQGTSTLSTFSPHAMNPHMALTGGGSQEGSPITRSRGKARRILEVRLGILLQHIFTCEGIGPSKRLVVLFLTSLVLPCLCNIPPSIPSNKVIIPGTYLP